MRSIHRNGRFLHVLAGLGFVLILPSAWACTVPPDDFQEAAWGAADGVVTIQAGRLVAFNVTTAVWRDLGGEWAHFSRIAAGPRGMIAHSTQEGLGGMCEGERYLDLWDIHADTRRERLPGAYQPLAGSLSTLVAGVWNTPHLLVSPWNETSDPIIVDAALDPSLRDHRHANWALRDDGAVLAIAERASGRLFLFDPRTGQPASGSVLLARDGFSGLPFAAFKPQSTVLLVLFAAEERSHLVLVDTAAPDPSADLVASFPSPLGSLHPAKAAWVEDGWVMGQGPVVRHIDQAGSVTEYMLREREQVANVVSPKAGDLWAALATNEEGAGIRLLVFSGSGLPVVEWAQDSAGRGNTSYLAAPSGMLMFALFSAVAAQARRRRRADG